MDRSFWRTLRQRFSNALDGGAPQINAIWNDPVLRDQNHNLLTIISPDIPQTEDVLIEVLTDAISRRHQTPFTSWIARQIFALLTPDLQCEMAFLEFIQRTTGHVADQTIQFRHMVTDFRWYDLFLSIAPEAFSLNISPSVLDCDRASLNFLNSISCTGLWQGALDDVIPYPRTYADLLMSIFALCVNLNILNPDLSIRVADNVRTNRTLTERSMQIQRLVDHANIDRQQILDNAQFLPADWAQAVRSRWRSTRGRFHGFQDSRGRTAFPQEQRRPEIQYVDYNEYTPHVNQGPLGATLYTDFFEVACNDDGRLDALRDVLIRYATRTNIRIPQSILTGWRQGICAWLLAEQVRRSEECSNRRDPFTLTDVEDIPLLFLWKVPTASGHVHCFDLIALFRHLQASSRNPLTQTDFHPQVIAAVRERYMFIYELMHAVLGPAPPPE